MAHYMNAWGQKERRIVKLAAIQQLKEKLAMGWFSKTEDDFFLTTNVI